MTEARDNKRQPYSYVFEAYGVTVCLESARKRLLERARQVVDRTLIGKARETDASKVDHTFVFSWRPATGYTFEQNGVHVATTKSAFGAFKYFDSIVRIAVAEYARDLVFLHAGVVGWRGKAIVIPGNSFSGKSTLVTELVKLGAEYYSDEFAIIDREGLVHPFARPINRRTDDGRHTPFTIKLADLGTVIGEKGIEIGTILVTEYKAGARFKPRRVTAGAGILAVLPHAIPLRFNADFTLSVLNLVSSRAVIMLTPRDDARRFAPELLDFIDNP